MEKENNYIVDLFLAPNKVNKIIMIRGVKAMLYLNFAVFYAHKN